MLCGIDWKAEVLKRHMLVVVTKGIHSLFIVTYQKFKLGCIAPSLDQRNNRYFVSKHQMRIVYIIGSNAVVRLKAINWAESNVTHGQPR